MPLQATRIAEPILGYTVRERIGAGGYGEVWSADAPGGLTKAIKFVYGFLDDERAARELKALSRIKQVRHPFLLSLERIEVIDRQLVIVTELADSSLKDRFDQCRKEGLPGIPRDELLSSLRDAADALDYMRESFSLQHLDVKPENLLLVGGRVKVADFGLVKDIHDATASMMGGLTPVYAPPEAFNDRPSLASDQYSLAIVYQEMLTGVLPFPGKTAAQLAQQHMQSKPRLGPLPVDDRPIVERALAKEPKDRFASCRELIDSLISGKIAGASVCPTDAGDVDATGDTTTLSGSDTHVAGPKVDDAAPAARGCATQVVGEASAVAAPSIRDTQTPASPGRTAARRRETIEWGPTALDDAKCGPRPTLVIGIGGTAAFALRRLRRRLHDRWGEVQGAALLLLDTDARALHAATEGDDVDALSHRETLAVPLRRSEDYRSDSGQLLQWMSRRWLYNIPRSLQTEGLRPLGRLAFADHADAIYGRVKQQLEAITSVEARAALEERSGLPLRDVAPRVFLLGSLSGGTGGGMAIDLGYLVRKALAELGLSADGLCAMLTHSTDRKSSARDLAQANAYAALNELYHFSRQIPYPGDAAAKLPALDACAPPFSQTYFVHLGDELSLDDVAVAAQRLADYLYLDICSPAGGLLDEIRCADDGSASADPLESPVRTLGVCFVGGGCDDFPAQATKRACRDLLRRWSGDGQDSGRNAARRAKLLGQDGETAPRDFAEVMADERVDAWGLDIDRLIESLYLEVQRTLDTDPESFLRDLVRRVGSPRSDHGQEADRARHWARVVGEINSTLGSLGPIDDDGAGGAVRNILEQHVDGIVRDRGKAIRDWCLELLNDPAHRAYGARRVAESLRQRLRALEDSASDMVQRFRGELSQADQAAAHGAAAEQPRSRMRLAIGGGDTRGDAESRALHYARSKFHAISFQSVRRAASALGSHAQAAVDQLRDYCRELKELTATFGDESPNGQDAIGVAATTLEERSHAQVDDALNDAWPEILSALDGELQSAYLASHGGLGGVMSRGHELRAELMTHMRATARRLTMERLRSVSPLDLLPADDGDSRDLGAAASSLLQSAAPKLGRCGGVRCVVLSAPQGGNVGSLAKSIAAERGAQPSVVYNKDGALAVCVEMGGLSLEAVAASLVDERPDCVELANRLHTRIDVAWQPFAPTH